MPSIHNRWQRLSWRKCLSHQVARFGMLPLALHTWTATASSYSHFAAHSCDLHPDCITWSSTSSGSPCSPSPGPSLSWILYFTSTCSQPFIRRVRGRPSPNSSIYAKPTEKRANAGSVFNFINRFEYAAADRIYATRKAFLRVNRCQDFPARNLREGRERPILQSK